MTNSKNIPGKYYERTNQMVYSSNGSGEPDGISTNDNDRIIVVAPKKEYYKAIAKGTYLGEAYDILDVFLFLYDADTGEQLAKETIAQGYNYKGMITVTVTFNTQLEFHEGHRIELRYGNTSGNRAGAAAFHYAAPGDFLVLIEMVH